MAENNKVKTEEKVEIFIPRANANEDPNFFISVNGVNYLLPKGKKSVVPPAVAKEYNRAVKAQEASDENKDKLVAAV